MPRRRRIRVRLPHWGAASAITTATGLGAAGLGAVAGTTYALASTVFHSGGGLTQAQAGAFGSTGSGVFNINLANLTGVSGGVATGIRNRHIQSAQGHNLTGSQRLFKGACPDHMTVAQCRGLGLDPGQMWRGDDYREVNTTLQMRAKYNLCKQQGKTGALPQIALRTWPL